MNQRWWILRIAALALFAALVPAPAHARGLGVEVWTDRGSDATYQPGEGMEVEARTSDDAYLLVYEIDAEGYVRLLFPYRGGSGLVEGRRPHRVPPDYANVDLVVQQPVGQCYVVALASTEQFRDLPWYLRPYDAQAEQIGYEGMEDEEQGVTAEGRIVGDPFVAMERIRRRVLMDPEDGESFATAYASYFVQTQVRYPRYLCYDCHRPGRWAWWSGFDPYYTQCSVFDFRVNWSWGWGPSYWSGYIPYYYYVVRPDCPPFYATWWRNRTHFSAWDGWSRYKTLWGNRLVRYKSDPPAGYEPPSKFADGRLRWKDGKSTPPGFLVTHRGGEGPQPRVVMGRGGANRGSEGSDGRGSLGSGTRRDGERMPRAPREPVGSDRGLRGRDVIDRGARPMPRIEDRPREDRPSREERGRRFEPPIRYEPPAREERGRRFEPPAPREDRGHRSDPPPREQRPPRVESPKQGPPRQEKPAAPPRSPRGNDGHRGWKTKG